MIKIMKFFKLPMIYLFLILVLAFSVRLYKLDSPVADWHSWRQADTAAVSRNFYKEGFNPFYPKYDDMSGVAEIPNVNTERYRFVEFPIYNSLVYFAYLVNGGVDERLARLVSIIFSLGSLVFVSLITKKYFGLLTSLVAAFLFAVLPFNIFFSRVILPEPSLIFFSLGMFYFVDRWIFEQKFWLYIFGVLFTALALLTKPMAIFYLLPLIYSYLKKESRLFPIPDKYLLLLIPAVIPFLIWRMWMWQHPEGVPASSWLFNGNDIRFRPAFWWWILQDRFGREILSVAGSILFAIGLFVKPKPKEGMLLHLLALFSFIYLIVFATGNVTHDYYQTFIVPALVIFTARGFVLLLEGVPSFIPRLWTIPFALLLLPLMIYFGWREIKGLYQINNGVIVEAGKYADKILPKDAKVLAPYGGDTSFLYQINRPGFPYVYLPVDEMVKKYKLTHYVSVNRDDNTNFVLKNYKIIEDNPKFVIADLREKVNSQVQDDKK
ncbi:MAG: hypothetical protein ACD_31C00003G0004 [uncultured bacterium]|uniref:Glycosyltransferase RgtA/B/C/D-like domain-containing protein n=3 Tax=Candidatus Daviesiibacteriota TaxID=1752718 RepID=A0A1F5K7D7_9BACT|nr:MAG: hypothetical protein ACD_31C00003G0004 [uncultured bacterium]OGE36571.1 MAG: hypothetical protein A3E66_02880 [Candidatus Daviesbacteria bacterium RIFCSPHIGHO2_12_FULL_37_16]